MTVDILRSLSLAAYIAAGVFFLVGVALFFLLDIPRVYGDVSGKTARKAIEAIRQRNEETGNKAYKPSAVNAERGKITDKITYSGRIIKKTGGLAAVSLETEKLQAQEAATTTVLMQEDVNATTVLSVGQMPAGQQATLPTEEAEEQGIPEAPVFTTKTAFSFTDSAEIIE